MADLPLLAERLFNRPLLATPRYAQIVTSVLANRLRVQPILSTDEVAASMRPGRAPMMTKDGIYVLPIVGGLVHRGDSIEAMSGGPTSYTAIHNNLLAAMDNPDVRAILLDIDSPGGQAVGCFELADAIADMGKRKPIRAVANGMACSAAYAIGASVGRDNFYVTPSGEVGSIGVVLMHVDYSEAMKEAGVAVTYIYAGRHKVDGNPYEPLPPSVRASIQDEIDARYEMFVAMVEKHRPMTAREIRKTEAGCFPADRAVELGLADEVASIDAVLTAMSRELRPASRVVSIPRTGANAMTITPAASLSIDEMGAAFDAAVDKARADTRALVTAEMQASVAEAYAKGRADAAAIFAHEAAVGRAPLAARIAGNAKFDVSEAVDMLAATPSEDGGASFSARLKAADPKVPADAAARADVPQADEYQTAVRGHLSRLINPVR